MVTKYNRQDFVNRRIGGLEMMAENIKNAHQVNRRTGGLETRVLMCGT